MIKTAKITTRDELLNAFADFTWCWGQEFIIRVNDQVFVWKDPDYDGNNTVTEQDCTHNELMARMGIDFGRCKGRHIVGNYCGEEIKVKFLDR